MVLQKRGEQKNGAIAKKLIRCSLNWEQPSLITIITILSSLCRPFKTITGRKWKVCVMKGKREPVKYHTRREEEVVMTIREKESAEKRGEGKFGGANLLNLDDSHTHTVAFIRTAFIAHSG